MAGQQILVLLVVVRVHQGQRIYRGVVAAVARQAHNLEVAGSNPAPATKNNGLSNQCDVDNHGWIKSSAPSAWAQRKL